MGGAVAEEGEERGPVGFFHDAGGLGAGDDGKAEGVDQFHGAIARRAYGARAVIHRHIFRKTYAGIFRGFFRGPGGAGESGVGEDALLDLV